MLPTKTLVILSLILSTLMIMSSSSWFIMWFALELNMMSFIPMISSNLNILSQESMMKYFLAQVSASLTFIFPFIATPITHTSFSAFLTFSPFIAMLMKLGASPFHQWFTSLAEGLLWPPLSILLTWQKIAPFIILIYLHSSYLVMTSSILSMIMASLESFNHTKLKKILILSSINHMGWLLILTKTPSTWTFYILLYSTIVITLSLTLLSYNLSSMSQLPNLPFTHLFILNLLSLAGLPPLLGFIPKWMTFIFIISTFPLMLIPTILSSIINIFIYLRLSFKTMTFSRPSIYLLPSNPLLIPLINSFSIFILPPSVLIMM